MKPSQWGQIRPSFPANLAAVVARRARDAGSPDIAAQVLIYPITDCVLERASYREFADGEYLLVARDMEWFWEHYLPEKERRSDPEASPLRTPDLSGLPPAIVVLAGHDPLRDEVGEYLSRLTASGVDVQVKEFGSMGHGFISLTGVVDQAAAAFDYITEQLAAALSRA